VRLDWTPWAPHAALYAADAQGYFEDEGIKVRLYVPPDPEATTQLVASGQDDFGISYMTDTILAREQGFQVVSLAALVKTPLNCIMALKKSGIDSPARMKGKTVGTTGVPSDQAFLAWVLAKNGIKEQDIRLVNLGFNLAPALKSGKVDAIIGAYWPWEGIKMTEEGFPVNVIKLQNYGVPDYYELVLISRDELVTKNPALVRHFLKAVSRGQQFVQDHPEKASAILQHASPDLRQEFVESSLRAVLPLMQSTDGPLHQDGNRWQEMLNFMKSTGLIKSPPPLTSLFTNSFLPEVEGTKGQHK
jgi:putative hydroxymethylpyrimidine transport system substrate-binding protein